MSETNSKTRVLKLTLDLSDSWRFYGTTTYLPAAMFEGVVATGISHSDALWNLGAKIGPNETDFYDDAQYGRKKVMHGYYDQKSDTFWHDFNYGD